MMRSDERKVMQLMSLCKGLWEMESWVKSQESGVECPLAKLRGTPARDRDRAPHQGATSRHSKQNRLRSRREVEWRRNRGRDGGPGPCGSGRTRN